MTNHRNSEPGWRAVLDDLVIGACLRVYAEIRDGRVVGVRTSADLPDCEPHPCTEDHPCAAHTEMLRAGTRIHIDPGRESRFQFELAGPYARTERNNPLNDKLNELYAEFSRENPPPWARIRELIEMGLSTMGAAVVLHNFGMEGEPSAPLRSEIDPEDSMGSGTDPGEAESWFREQQYGTCWHCRELFPAPGTANNFCNPECHDRYTSAAIQESDGA